ncbi:MAG: hypothetical protein ACE5KZ_02225 [Candidatus Scalinduaceae bacterium]
MPKIKIDLGKFRKRFEMKISDYINNSNKAITCMVVIVTGVWFSSLFFLPKDAFWSGDMGVKLIQVNSFISKQYSGISLDYPGRDIDPQLKFYPLSGDEGAVLVFEVDGKMYSKDQVFFTFLSSFFYKAFGYSGLYVISFFAGAFTLILTFLICKHSPARKYAWCSIFLIGLATPLWFYSITFWGHTLATFLFSLALFLMILGRQKGNLFLFFVSGLIIGVGIWSRPEIYLLVVASIAALILDNKDRKTKFQRIMWMLIGTLLLLLPMWGFNLMIFNKPFTPHMAQLSHSTFTSLVYSFVSTLTMLFHGPLQNIFHDLLLQIPFAILFVLSINLKTDRLWPKLFSIVLLSCILVSFTALLKTDRTVSGLVPLSPFIAFSFLLLSYPINVFREILMRDQKIRTISSVFNILFSFVWVAASLFLFTKPEFTVILGLPYQGRFFWPIAFILLAIIQILLVSWLLNKRDEKNTIGFVDDERVWVKFLGVIFIVYILLTCVSTPSPGGNEYGPRYLLPLYPVLIVLTLIAVTKLFESGFFHVYKKVFFLSFIILFGLSVMFQVKGVKILNEKKKACLSLVRATQKLGSQVVITDALNYPWETASIFYEKKLFYISDKKKLAGLLNILVSKDIDEFIFVTWSDLNKSLLNGMDTLLPYKIQSSPSDRLYVSSPILLGNFVLQKYKIMFSRST